MTEITLKQVKDGDIKVGEGNMFVNYNRFLKPFIRACKTNESKTFSFNNTGLKAAIKYLEG
ncbi:hypothetical protein D3C73_1448500 [compost metagenome]